MRTDEFDYSLPQALIAQSPAEPRDSSRLMVLHRQSGTAKGTDASSIAHRRFYEIAEYLRAGDLMVLNNTRVVPGRLFGQREPSGGKVEVLLLRRIEAGLWEALVKPGRRLKDGDKVVFSTSHPGAPLSESGPGPQRQAEVLTGRIRGRLQSGARIISFSAEPTSYSGQIPLPPYIHSPLTDPERYQTVYSQIEGSAAAPTAGLHFTKDLLNTVKGMGVHIEYITLHIGLDTFRPVREEDPRLHAIHKEAYTISSEAAEAVSRARDRGNRVIVVGTSTARALEQAALDQGIGPDTGENHLSSHEGWASLLILPGYHFRMVDVMITNFHLPRSTLLMMISAFAGKDTIRYAYEEAIRQRYRFYSFGDCMLII
ncbi:MAG: tRNA preQ1(34) S-adenosylmethionine ribosyltransferase-isomerase QueA [Dehalococcoidia bacterium]|nr:tRNA preQ1(34) S-adenosylmethionine ribosyltransferase-isomerase QueA [Dehalococcoidia bacterium]